MADPKKAEDEKQHSSKQGGPEGQPKSVLPDDMAYPTPELDPNTGAPLDTRFQSGSQEATASQQSPKSDSEAQRQAQRQEQPAQRPEDEEDDNANSDKAKTKEKPRGRR